jgi:colicin import membrane protein
MRRGILLSVLFHTVFILAMWINLPDFVLPEEKVTLINVKIVTATNVAKTTKPEQTKPTPTQQSAAPSAPPKKREKPVEAPKHSTQVVSNAQSRIKQQAAKKEDPRKTEDESKTTELRPEKLDKTRDKKNVKKSKEKPTDPPKEDDFLKALDFVEELKNRQSAQEEGEDMEPTVVDAEMSEVAELKKHIEQNWYRPPGIKGLDELSIIVLVRVNRDGTISSLEVSRSSGQAFFDDSLLRAVRKSVPLPIPADKYDLFRNIELRFNG